MNATNTFRKILLITLITFYFSLSSQTIYYSKSAGNLNVLATWGLNTDGTGAPPANFTSPTCTYIITNTTSVTIAANWAVSGTGSRVQLGDGVSNVEFVVPTTAAYTGTIDVTNGATLRIFHSTLPVMGTLSPGSTVNYARTGTQTVRLANYSNLIISGTGQKNMQNVAGNASVSNSLVIEANTRLRLTTNATRTVTLSGNISGAGGILGNGNTNLVINGTGNFGVLTFTNTLTLRQLTINRTGGGLVTLGSNLTVSNNFTHTNGLFNLNGNLLILSGGITFPSAISNGAFVGSNTSSLTINASTLSVTNPILMDQTNLSTRSLSRFAINRLGQTLTLGNDLIVENNFVHTACFFDLNNRSLSISGIISFPSTAVNGCFIGSASASLSVLGAGAISNTLKFDQTNFFSRNLNAFNVDQTGANLTFGSDIYCNGSFVHTNGPIALGGNLLSLTGNITFPIAVSNGSIIGSATSSLSIEGAGNIVNALFFAQNNAAARTLSSFVFDRTAQTLNLGNNIIINAFSQTNGIINIGSSLLTMNGEINFPATLTNGYFVGSPTSSLAIGVSTAAISNPLSMDQTNLNSRTLGQFVLNRTGQTVVLANNLIVDGNFVQTNGVVDINGRLLSIAGTIAFPAAITNGYFIGSPTSSLSIGGVGTISNALRLDQTNTNSRTLNALIADQTGGTLILGSDIICASMFTHNNGPITIGATHLTLNGAITFPVAASNGSFTGSTSSSLTIAGSGVINNTLFMSQVSAAARTFNSFSFDRSGQTLVLGNPLITNTFSHVNGTINLNGTSLAMNAAISFPASAANGVFTGSPSSTLTIAANVGTITNSLFMNQLNANSRSLSLFTISRVGQTFTLGNDLIVLDGFTHTAARIDLNGRSLSINGVIIFPTTVANGYFIGSASSSLSIGGAGAINNTLKFDETNTSTHSLHTFSVNQSGGTLTFGSNITCENNFAHINGPITIGANLLSLNGNITFPVSASNGSFTGATTSSLSIEGSGSIINPLFMSQVSAAARTFNNFTMNRAAQTLTLGNQLTANVFTHTNGLVDLNSNQLTLNGIITFPTNITNGSFIGSTSSSLAIGGSGLITNTLKMEQTNAANRSLYDLTMSRGGQTLSIGTPLEIRNELRPSNGNITTGGFITLKADANRTAMLGVVGGVVSGNLNVENFAPGNFTGWTNLGTSGITGLTVADWESQIIMTCIGCPFGPNSAGGYFVSIQSYSETLSGSAAYVPLSYTTPLTRGIGYWVYLGSSLYTTTPISYSFTGPPATGNVNIPVTVSANSGFNLVSNPYPAPIDWDLVALDLANLNLTGAVYVYNPDLAQTVSYVGGISSPSGYMTNGIIPMGQAFYVQAILPGNVTFRESHKSDENTNANPLLRPELPGSIGSVFRLSIQGSNEDYDETAIRFHAQATDTFDHALDATKIFQTPGYRGTASVYTKYTSISTRLHEKDYSINSLSQSQPTDLVIPILAKAQTTGAFTISPIEIHNFDPNACIILRDKLLNLSHNLRTGPYVCTISDTTSTPRFELQICKGAILDANVVASLNDKITIGQEDGAIVYINTQFNDVTASTISVYSLMGQKIQDDFRIEGTKNSVRLDLDNYKNQLVLVKVSNEKGQTVKKVYLH